MQNNPLKRKMTYLCAMYNKILCLAFIFALALSVMAEDLQSVMKFYKPDMSKGFIFVSKVDMTLTLVNSQGKVVATYPIACGMNIGQKRVTGDHRTPEGYFLLEKIHDSANWGHDFHDGNGFIKHAYGPYFLRLRTGFQGIGIHGTHAPGSIGSRATEGCIRLENNNVEALERQVTVGMPVIIGPEEGVSKLIASNAQRPDLPYWTTGGTKPARTSTPSVQKRKPKVVDGEIDIDPEQDLVEDVVEKPVQKVASKPVETTVAAKPVEVEVAKPVEKAEDKPVGTMVRKPAKGPVFVKPDEKPAKAVVEKPVETTVVENPVTTSVEVEKPVQTVVSKPVDPVVEKPVEPVAEKPVEAEPETPKQIQVEMVIDKATESTESAAETPRYEVVVEEVTAPDGTVKYEVHYKPIK